MLIPLPLEPPLPLPLPLEPPLLLAPPLAPPAPELTYVTEESCTVGARFKSFLDGYLSARAEL